MDRLGSPSVRLALDSRSMSAYTITNFEDIGDAGPERRVPGEVRPFADRLGAPRHQPLPYAPNYRATGGHSHREQEEVYVVISGSGRVKLDDEIIELKQWDVVRVSPPVVRAFEGGPEGMELDRRGQRPPRGRRRRARRGLLAEAHDGRPMIVNRAGEASFAGIPTFAKLPLVLDPAELAGVDVAILGAPMDETVSNRPGSRYGPRAIRQADEASGLPPSRPHMLLGVDPVRRAEASSTTATQRPSRATRRAATTRSASGSPRSAPPARSRSCSAATTRSPTRT